MMTQKMIKKAILSAGYSLKIFDILKMLQKKHVLILMYHRFSEKDEPFKLKQDVFERQITFLKKKKYRFVSLAHYVEFLNGKRDSLPDNAVIITFDDGYEDNFLFAYPVLKKHDIPATIFLTTDFISHRSWLWSNRLEYILKTTAIKEFELMLGDKKDRFNVSGFENWHRTQLGLFAYCRTISDHKKNSFLDDLSSMLKVKTPDTVTADFQPLSWDQILEMSRHNIEFGSHSCSHPILSKSDSEELEHEIYDSKKEIENRLNLDISIFCYPNGQADDINDEVLHLVKKAGYSSAVTTIPGVNKPGATETFMLKRKCIYTDDKYKLFKEITGAAYRSI